MSGGRIVHGSRDGVQLLCYQGEIRYPTAAAVDACIALLLGQQGLKGFVVDLTAVEMIDSTHLGILARLAKAMRQAGLPPVTLVSNRPAVDELLEGMGFHQVFHIVPESGVELERMREIPPAVRDPAGMRRLLLETHQALMEMNPRNREAFRDVVEAFGNGGG